MSRAKAKRSPSKLRRLERRARERQRMDALREEFIYAHMLDEANVLAAAQRDFTTDGLVVCETCGLVQPYVRAEAEDGESNVHPCLRGVLLGLPCDGQTAVTLEAYAEAA